MHVRVRIAPFFGLERIAFSQIRNDGEENFFVQKSWVTFADQTN